MTGLCQQTHTVIDMSEISFNKGNLHITLFQAHIHNAHVCDLTGMFIYSRTSMARTPLGPCKLVRDRGSSSQ